MSEELWTAVDTYYSDLFRTSDDVLESALAANKTADLPAIDVSANQGKFLSLLVKMCGARRVLEVGTLGGYSTIWLARALPAGGHVITLEIDAKHADVARANLVRAELADRVEVRVGPALETMQALADEMNAQDRANDARVPFDFIFIDADKPNNPHYLQSALALSRPGTVIVVDNVVRDGEVVNVESDDPNVRGVRAFSELLAREPRLTATVIQTVGSKGYDGFAIALVTS